MTLWAEGLPPGASRTVWPQTGTKRPLRCVVITRAPFFSPFPPLPSSFKSVGTFKAAGKGSTRMPLGSPGGSEGKVSVRNVGDLGSIPGEGNGNLLHYSCLQDPMDGATWQIQSTGSQSQTQLSDFTFLSRMPFTVSTVRPMLFQKGPHSPNS